MGVFDRLRKGVKKKKVELKAARNKRQREREQRRQRRAERKMKFEDFTSDVREAASATRLGGAARAGKRAASGAADLGERTAEAGGGALDALDDSLEGLDEATGEGPQFGGGMGDDLDEMGEIDLGFEVGSPTDDDDDEIQFI